MANLVDYWKKQKYFHFRPSGTQKYPVLAKILLVNRCRPFSFLWGTTTKTGLFIIV
jgi:hypothetical protein